RASVIVLLNLPSNEAVIDAVFGANGVASALSAKQLVADFSTIPVDECRRHAKRLLEKTGSRGVDLPVSGGPPASGTGSLTVMAGGEEADLERLAPLLRDISPRCPRLGAVGR